MAINVKKKSGDLDAVAIYFMTQASNTEKVSDHAGEIIEYTAYCLYEEENEKGDPVEVLALLQPDDIAIATNSATFIRSFFKMVDLFTEMGEADKLGKIQILSDTSKSNRTYYDCVYVRPE